MGEITYIANGLSTTIHDDGSKTTTPLQQCDECFSWEGTLGGMTYRLADGMDVLWLCYKCRK